MPGRLHAHVYYINIFRTSSRSYYHYVSVTISTKPLLSVSNTQTLINHANSSIIKDEYVLECDALV